MTIQATLCTHSNGETAMKEISHPALDQRVFREVNGYLEWAHEADWLAHGWGRARTYGTVIKPIQIVCVNVEERINAA